MNVNKDICYLIKLYIIIKFENEGIFKKILTFLIAQLYFYIILVFDFFSDLGSKLLTCKEYPL